MDKLDTIFATQAQAQRNRGYDFALMTKAERVTYLKKHAQYLSVELSEFLAELPLFKDWKRYPPDMEIANEAACEELSDVLHFLINICIAMGLTADNVYDLFNYKASINAERLTRIAVYKKDTEVDNNG